MKVFLLTSLIALTIGATAFYKYTSSTETFADKLAKIADEVNAMNTTWKAGRNIKWENQDEESVLNFMIRPELHATETVQEHKLKRFSAAERSAVPESFDSLKKWSNCSSIGDITDQSACGSCWAMAAAEVMSDRICINRGLSNVRISPVELMSCCTSCGYGCNGGRSP